MTFFQKIHGNFHFNKSARVDQHDAPLSFAVIGDEEVQYEIIYINGFIYYSLEINT